MRSGFFVPLLCCIALPCAAATVADTVTREARRHLLDQAAAAGLADAAVTLQFVGKTPAAPCAGAIDVAPVDTRHPTRMKFAAHCGASGWREEFVVRGELAANVVVATARLAAGRPIGAADVALEKREVAGFDGATSRLDAIVGQSSRRAVRAGQVVDPRWLAQATLVRRGAAVSIVARNGPVQVTTSGEALAAGRQGELIDVRNTTTGRVIRARVTASNTVEPAEMPVAPMPQSVR